MSKVKLVVVVAAFVVFFVACYALLQKLPSVGMEVRRQTASLVPAQESAAGAREKVTDVGGRGATRDLSKIVEAYSRHEELAKIGSTERLDVTTTPARGGGGESEGVQRAPERTPPPTMGIIREWPTGRKRIALTFDDGPHPDFTPKFLALLASKKVRATFFLLGPNAEKHPELVKAIAEAGHEIGNHSWSHPVLNKLTPDKIREELTKTNSTIEQAVGSRPHLMRPPYGSANKKVQEICQELGLRIICWSVDTDDWRKATTAEKMWEIVKKNVRDGAIVLMHDRYDKSLETTAKTIDEFRAQGYEFVTVSELLGLGTSAGAVKAAAPSLSGSVGGSESAARPVQVATVAQEAAPMPQGRASLPVPALVAGSATTTNSVADMPSVDASKITRPPQGGSRRSP